MYKKIKATGKLWRVTVTFISSTYRKGGKYIIPLFFRINKLLKEGGIFMPKNDKKQEILELLEQIDNSNEYALFCIYGTVKTALVAQEASKQGSIERG